MAEKWVQTWGQAHSSFSFFYYPSCAKTFRIVIRASVSGKSIRAELSNECAKNDVFIGGLTAAKCDENGSFIGECKTVTVNSKEKFRIRKGEVLLTDPVDLELTAGEYSCLSAFVEKGALRSGNLIDNVSLITAKGNVAAAPCVENQRRVRDSVREVASKVLGMFFHKPIPLFQSVQLLNNDGASSIVVFGDSISQQGYWTNAFARRIYEKYPGRYSVINKSIMGNRVLRDFSKRFICKGLFGKGGINRLERDVLAYPDTEFVIFALGTNDFLQYNSIAAPKNEKPTAKQVFDAVADISRILGEKGIKTVVFNVMNFGECFDSSPEKTAMVSEYNTLLEENRHLFHAVYDQAALCVNPDKPDCSRLEYLGGDKLHPNVEGGRLVAENVDLDWFKEELCV